MLTKICYTEWGIFCQFLIYVLTNAIPRQNEYKNNNEVWCENIGLFKKNKLTARNCIRVVRSQLLLIKDILSSDYFVTYMVNELITKKAPYSPHHFMYIRFNFNFYYFSFQTQTKLGTKYEYGRLDGNGGTGVRRWGGKQNAYKVRT